MGNADQQLGLDFDPPPIARRRDPTTSHDAAAFVTHSGARGRVAQAVLDVVRAHPGLTGREIAERAGLEAWGVSKRLSDLKATALIRPAGTRRCSITQREVTVWEAVT